jgi:hypothetical protein
MVDITLNLPVIQNHILKAMVLVQDLRQSRLLSAL